MTYHYETQCIPTPLAWFAHQLPVWWQKLSVVGTFVIEIAVPVLFFSPLRRLRLGAFYTQVNRTRSAHFYLTYTAQSKADKSCVPLPAQVLLQVLIILSGNYNFFNLLTLALCLSLLDDQHVYFWLCRRDKLKDQINGKKLQRWLLMPEEQHHHP